MNRSTSTAVFLAFALSLASSAQAEEGALPRRPMMPAGCCNDENRSSTICAAWAKKKDAYRQAMAKVTHFLPLDDRCADEVRIDSHDLSMTWSGSLACLSTNCLTTSISGLSRPHGPPGSIEMEPGGNGVCCSKERRDSIECKDWSRLYDARETARMKADGSLARIAHCPAVPPFSSTEFPILDLDGHDTGERYETLHERGELFGQQPHRWTVFYTKKPDNCGMTWTPAVGILSTVYQPPNCPAEMKTKSFIGQWYAIDWISRSLPPEGADKFIALYEEKSIPLVKKAIGTRTIEVQRPEKETVDVERWGVEP